MIMSEIIFIEPAVVKRDIAVTILLRCMCVCASVHPDLFRP